MLQRREIHITQITSLPRELRAMPPPCAGMFNRARFSAKLSKLIAITRICAVNISLTIFHILFMCHLFFCAVDKVPEREFPEISPDFSRA